MAKDWMPASLTAKGLRKNYALIPLLGIVGAGGVWCAYYCWRLAVKSPEVMWQRRSNPEPWNEYDKKQYKMYSSVDVSKYEHPRPRYEEEK